MVEFNNLYHYQFVCSNPVEAICKLFGQKLRGKMVEVSNLPPTTIHSQVVLTSGKWLKSIIYTLCVLFKSR